MSSSAVVDYEADSRSSQDADCEAGVGCTELSVSYTDADCGELLGGTELPVPVDIVKSFTQNLMLVEVAKEKTEKSMADFKQGLADYLMLSIEKRLETQNT